MKSLFSHTLTKSFFSLFLVVAMFSSCSKDDPAPAFQGKTKVYTLYNFSNPGAGVPAGSFTITELSDGNARGTVNIAAGFRVSGVTFRSNITFQDLSGTEFVYASLADVDGGTGVGETEVITLSSSNAPIKYVDIITKAGYTIKVLNGSNLQAVGTIQ